MKMYSVMDNYVDRWDEYKYIFSLLQLLFVCYSQFPMPNHASNNKHKRIKYIFNKTPLCLGPDLIKHLR